MATIKSHTDLFQSKKLAEILQLESADMCCFQNQNGSISCYEFPFLQVNKASNPIPVWSLAALLSVLPDCPDLSKHTDNKWYITTYPNGVHTCLMGFDNAVDACYEMIIRLHELNLL